MDKETLQRKQRRRLAAAREKAWIKRYIERETKKSAAKAAAFAETLKAILDTRS